MITVDLHIHTKYSHGSDTPAQMYAAALDKGLTVLGFSEHSPRPQGFDYLHEYRDQLTRHLPDYAREVLALKAAPRAGAAAVPGALWHGNGLAGRSGGIYAGCLRGV